MKQQIVSHNQDFQCVNLQDIDLSSCIWTNRPETPKCKYKYECFEDDECPYNVKNCRYRPIDVKSMLL